MKQIETCLFGFYFPLEQRTIYLVFDENSTPEYKKMLQDYLNNFLEAIEWQNEKENICLIGHNIYGFDLPLLASFCDNFNKSLYILCDNLINSTKFSLHSDAQNKVFSIVSKCMICDTLLAKQERGNDRNSLFAQKMQFFLSKKTTLQPKEMYFNWENMTLKQLCFYNSNDLYYTYLVFEHDQPCHVLFESRYLSQTIFTKENKSGLPIMPLTRMMVTKTPVLNTQFIANQTNLPAKRQFEYLNASDIVYLYNFKHIETHKRNMCLEGKKIGRNYRQVLEKKGGKYKVNFQLGFAEFKPSLGGLHNQRLKMNKTRTNVKSYNNMVCFGDQIKVFIEDENFMAIQLDFQSYYVSLLLLLHKKLDPESKVSRLLEAFNENRLIAKKMRTL